MLTILRLLPVLAGLFGAAGVGLAAAASHGGDVHLLGNASLMCLVHAPALIAIALYGERKPPVALPGLLLAVGTVLFAGDLVNRHFTGGPLFPMAAPTGGMIMIGGWLLFALAGFLPRRG